MTFEDTEPCEAFRRAHSPRGHGSRVRPPGWFRVGCITFGSLGVGVPLAGLLLAVALWQCGYFGDPRFIRDVEPDYAHRVHVNRCCGGSREGTDPLQIFYGSTEPFDQIIQHYRVEMERRGFLMYAAPFAPQLVGHQTYDFEKNGWHHCFAIEPYAGHDPLGVVKQSDLAGLQAYPYAYVATYLDFCDQSWDEWPYSAQFPVCRDTPERCYPPETHRNPLRTS